ncbi:MAG: hypothetical protein WCJ56_12250 [bacterium]
MAQMIHTKQEFTFTSACLHADLLQGWTIAMPERASARTIYYRLFVGGDVL